jgi:hypothetical protein
MQATLNVAVRAVLQEVAALSATATAISQLGDDALQLLDHLEQACGRRHAPLWHRRMVEEIGRLNEELANSRAAIHRCGRIARSLAP